MKKTLFSILIVTLLSAGCSSTTESAAPPLNSTTVPTQIPPQTPSSPTPNQGVNLNTLSPSSGPVGTKVLIKGRGFTLTDNSVDFGTGATISGISSVDGTSLEFVIPAKNDPPKCPNNAMCVPLPISQQNYSVMVQNNQGVSNSLIFTVTQRQTGTPVILTISPPSGPAGTSVILSGAGFEPSGNTISFGGNVLPGTYSSSDGSTLDFVVPQELRPNCNPNQACPQYIREVIAGDYDVFVSNSGGQSKPVEFTVTGNDLLR